MSLPNYLAKIKSAGIYRFVWDKSEVTATDAETLRLVVGYSEKGPFNTPVYIENTADFKTIFGDINKKLERRGVFFHRMALQALSAGPILALNLKKFSDEKVQYVSANGADAFSTPTDIDVTKVYNTSRFWSLDPDGLTDLSAGDYITIAAADSITASNSIFMRPCETTGYDVTIKTWYTTIGEDMPDYFEGYEDLKVSDFFAEIYVFRGGFTPSIASSEELKRYFTVTGDKITLNPYVKDAFGQVIDTLDALADNENSGFIQKYRGVLLPFFKGTNGAYISLDLLFNADYNAHKMLMKFNADLIDDGTITPAQVTTNGWYDVDEDMIDEMVDDEVSTGINKMSNTNMKPTCNIVSLVDNSEADRMTYDEPNFTAYGVGDVEASNGVIEIELKEDANDNIQEGDRFLMNTEDGVKVVTLMTKTTSYKDVEPTEEPEEETTVVDAIKFSYDGTEYKLPIDLGEVHEDDLVVGNIFGIYHEETGIVPDADVHKVIIFARDDESQFDVLKSHSVIVAVADDAYKVYVVGDDESQFDDENDIPYFGFEIIYGYTVMVYDNQIADDVEGEIIQLEVPATMMLAEPAAEQIKVLKLAFANTTAEPIDGYIIRCERGLYGIADMSPIYIKGYVTNAAYIKPENGSIEAKLAWQNKILEAINPDSAVGYPGLIEALTNGIDIDFRYIVDTFESFPGPGELKAQLSLIAKKKDNCLALLNFPSIQSFVKAKAASFTDEHGAFQMKYVKNGYNPAKPAGYMFKLPSIDNGASWCSINTPVVFSDGTVKTVVPAAALVSNNFMAKYEGRQPYYIVAGPIYGRLIYPGLVGPDYNFTRGDLDILEPMGVNATVYVPRKGTFINSNQTAKQTPVTALSKINVRELVIYLQDQIHDLLQNYQWEFNTDALRELIKAKADTICENIRANGGIHKFLNVCDRTNNTDDVINNEMIVLSTSIEPGMGAGKMVQELTIYKRGGMTSTIS